MSSVVFSRTGVSLAAGGWTVPGLAFATVPVGVVPGDAGGAATGDGVGFGCPTFGIFSVICPEE